MIAGYLFDAIILIIVVIAVPFGLLCGIERVSRSRSQRLPNPDVRRHFDWARTGKNRAVRLPSDADLGKIDPIPIETARLESSIEIKGAGFQSLWSDRRVTRAEFDEIMPEPNEVWTRIGARPQDASMRTDDMASDNTS
jgi:hypothetical protein